MGDAHRQCPPALSPSMARPVFAVFAALALLLGLCAAPSIADACALDGLASLSADGEMAVPALDASAATARVTGAACTFRQAYAAGEPLRLTEDRATLRRSLPAAILAHPFRWTFGDGGVAQGATGLHRYMRPGRYVVTVQGYWPAHRRWAVFDTARVQIVTRAALFRANALSWLDRGLSLLLTGLIYAAVAALVLAALWARVARRRGRRAPRLDPPELIA
jgi:membrane protein DedA with SNARE-associated domain